MMFGTKFSRNTLNKPEYRELWHPKYTQEVTIPKEPGFSFRLAMGCFKAIAKKVLVTLKLLIDSKKQVTKERQPQKETSQTIQKTIAPPPCSIEKPVTNKNAETQAVQEFGKNDQTLMKCCVGAASYLAYKVFVLKAELIKSEIRQQLEDLFTPEIKTSETKLDEIREARSRKGKRKNSYFYHGVQLCTLPAFDRRRRKSVFNRSPRKPVKKLQPGTRVKILTDYHSSSLGDDNRQILVYVRPIESEGKEKYSVPLNTLIHETSDSDLYVKAVLPQIKGLVAALGLTKDDYRQYLQQTYSVESIGQLRSTEIFEVVTHFQNLFYSIFDGWLKVSNRSFST